MVRTIKSIWSFMDENSRSPSEVTRYSEINGVPIESNDN